jgi:hypothetical protein
VARRSSITRTTTRSEAEGRQRGVRGGTPEVRGCRRPACAHTRRTPRVLRPVNGIPQGPSGGGPRRISGDKALEAANGGHERLCGGCDGRLEVTAGSLISTLSTSIRGRRCPFVGVFGSTDTPAGGRRPPRVGPRPFSPATPTGAASEPQRMDWSRTSPVELAAQH